MPPLWHIEGGFTRGLGALGHWISPLTSFTSPSYQDIYWAVAVGVVSLIAIAFYVNVPNGDGRILVIVVGDTTFFILAWAWFSMRNNSKCPSCKRSWASEVTRINQLGEPFTMERIENVTVGETRNHKGEVIATQTERRQCQVLVTKCQKDYGSPESHTAYSRFVAESRVNPTFHLTKEKADSGVAGTA